MGSLNIGALMNRVLGPIYTINIIRSPILFREGLRFLSAEAQSLQYTCTLLRDKANSRRLLKDSPKP